MKKQVRACVRACVRVMQMCACVCCKAVCDACGQGDVVEGVHKRMDRVEDEMQDTQVCVCVCVCVFVCVCVYTRARARILCVFARARASAVPKCACLFTTHQCTCLFITQRPQSKFHALKKRVKDDVEKLEKKLRLLAQVRLRNGCGCDGQLDVSLMR